MVTVKQIIALALSFVGVQESPANSNNVQFNTDYYGRDKPGDWALFNFQGGMLAGHIGLVESVNANGTINTIEGNTSVTSQDNGGEVMQRVRELKYILGAYRPDYSIEQEDDIMDFKNMTDAQVDELLIRISTRLSAEPTSDYAVASSEKAVLSGLFSDGDKNGLVDDPQGFMRRQEAAVLFNRAGLLDK